MSDSSSSGAVASSHPLVSVVIVNWREADETLGAIAALRAQSVAPYRTYVVDNGSGDGSAERLQDALAQDPTAIVIATEQNLGFPGGCNRGLEQALHDGSQFVWLLNNDARPAPDCLAELIDEMLKGGGATGVVGSWISDPEQSGHDHSGSWMRPWLLNCGTVRSTDDLDQHRFSWVTAASVLIDTDAFRRIGIFDEGFFMYWDDADLAMRMRAAGYRIAIATGAHVEHRAGTSSAGIPVQRYLWHFRSQRLWLGKHHPYPRLSRALLRMKFLAKALLDRDLARFKALTNEA